jgi:hypothetical protein
MTAELALTAAPDYAVQLWCDLRSIYMQFPSQNGPCIVSFARNTMGLAKALDLLRSRHATEGAGTPYTSPPPPIKRDSRFSPKQQDIVRDVLRRRGILGR